MTAPTPSQALAASHPPPSLRFSLALVLTQGCLLFALYLAQMDGIWLSQTPVLNYPIWAVVLVWPTMALLAAGVGNSARALTMVSAFTAVVALLAAYLGWQASPPDEVPGSVLPYAIPTTLIACFKALMYMQPWAARQDATYGLLFALSWRNFIVVTLAALATAIFFGLAQLFGILLIPILLLFNLLAFPILAVAFGVGIHIFRDLANLIDGIAGLLEGLMRLLLPLAVGGQIVSFVALIALPFVGMEGVRTAVLLCLQGFVLFGINAVYQTGDKMPYPKLVHRLLYVGIAFLPLVTALAAHGIYLRVGQHGWSVDRCWGAVTCALFGFFSLAYVWLILRKRDVWPIGLGRVNRALGLLVLAVMLLANSPLLDFRAISLASQWARVESGEVAIRDFDFYYVKWNLGRPGWRKMQELIEEYETSDPALAQFIREAKSKPSTSHIDWTLVPRPDHVEVPRSVERAAADLLEDDWRFGFDWPMREANPADWRWIVADLDADGERDYVLILASEKHVLGIRVAKGDGGWQTGLLAPRNLLPAGTNVAEMVRDGEIRIAERTARDLVVGDLVLGERAKLPDNERWVVVEQRRG